jgi:hypothetical protein
MELQAIKKTCLRSHATKCDLNPLVRQQSMCSVHTQPLVDTTHTHTHTHTLPEAPQCWSVFFKPKQHLFLLPSRIAIIEAPAFLVALVRVCVPRSCCVFPEIQLQLQPQNSNTLSKVGWGEDDALEPRLTPAVGRAGSQREASVPTRLPTAGASSVVSLL